LLSFSIRDLLSKSKQESSIFLFARHLRVNSSAPITIQLILLDIVKSIINPLLDFIYPPVCISCNMPLPDGNKKVCRNCWNAIPPLTKSHSLYQETRTKLLSEGHIDDLISCYVFEREGPFQYIAHALKYQEYKSLGIELGQRIGRLIQDWNVETDIIVPVPLHRIKHRERGYNQSECIAQGIASIICKPIIIDLVHRTRHTQTQTKLNFQERHINMKNAFEIGRGGSKKINGRKCVVVDDVITTGATINSCASVLLAAGARKIAAVSAAIAK
jgi:ComF family protein